MDKGDHTLKILIVSSIDPDAINQLREHHDVVCAFNAKTETLPALIKDREVLIFRSGISIKHWIILTAKFRNHLAQMEDKVI